MGSITSNGRRYLGEYKDFSARIVGFCTLKYKEMLLAVVSGVLLFLPFPENNVYLLEWIAFVPLLYAVKDADYRETFIYSLITGVVSVCLGFSWMPYLFMKFAGVPVPLNYVCWGLFGFYNAQLITIIFLLFKLLKEKTRVNELVIFPFVLVSVWSVFPSIFYCSLSNGQSTFLTALQGTEFTGPFGLDFLIALFNIMAFMILKRDFSRKSLAGYSISAVLLVIWFVYGFSALETWDKEIETWERKKIGIIQPNRPSSFTQRLLEKGETLDKPFELELYKKMSRENPAFVVWPEGQRRDYLKYQKVHDAYNRTVRTHKAPLIIHDLHAMTEGNKKVFRNSAILIDSNGFNTMYHKRKLVPFGEYIPVLNHFFAFSKKLGLQGLTAGEKNTVFSISSMMVQPLICYEILFPRFVAEAINGNAGRIMLVQSNDGWYGKGSLAEQHRSSNALRAVENRTPMIHVINNGKSSVVMPNGRVIYLSKEWQRSADIVDVPYSAQKGGSFFSNHSDLFIGFVRVVFLIFIGFAFAHRFTPLRFRKGKK